MNGANIRGFRNKDRNVTWIPQEFNVKPSKH